MEDITNSEFMMLPGKIATAEVEIVELREKVRLKELEIEIKEAKKLLQSSGLKNLNFPRQRAWASSRLESEKKELIKLKKELELAEVEFNRLTNLFLAYRKQASYRMSEMKYLE